MSEMCNVQSSILHYVLSIWSIHFEEVNKLNKMFDVISFFYEILWIHILSGGSLYPQCNTTRYKCHISWQPYCKPFYLEVCSGGVESHGQSVSEAVENQNCVLGNCDVAKRNNNWVVSNNSRHHSATASKSCVRYRASNTHRSYK